jgi:hypothetical protein
MNVFKDQITRQPIRCIDLNGPQFGIVGEFHDVCPAPENRITK